MAWRMAFASGGPVVVADLAQRFAEISLSAQLTAVSGQFE